MAITEIEDKISKIIDNDDHSTFIYDFLSVYDIPKATITKLRKGINNLSDVDGEVYLKNKLYYKQTDKDLMQSFTDVKAKVDELGTKPRYIFVTNFKEVLAYDTKTEDTLSIPFERLPQKFEFFLAWNGIEKADFDKENPADVRAAERFAKLYDVIVKDNPDASRHGLNLFLIRVLFCLFAEDTDIFEKNVFTNRLKQLTKLNGSDVDDFIGKLFSVLDVKIEERPEDTPSWLSNFPYVDGDLFKDPHESLKFTAKSRKLIIDAGEKLEWDQINPDILGSMLQAVASEDSRSHLGIHYTSVPNIMKVIKPLFLDDLREEFEKSKNDNKKLQELYDRIGKIKFMDPACGSGNFLIVTYKQLRQLEIDIIKAQNNLGIATMYIPSVTLDQFYGIEIDDFACDTTRLSLWIAEHQMNIKLREEVKDAVRPTLPLQHAGAIVCGNALRLDWEKILPHKKDDEVYLFGNPPYLGAKWQSKDQKKDLQDALYSLDGSFRYKKLDYISGWFAKGTKYINGTRTQLGFVTTNSISQGEQVSLLWSRLLKYIQIKFAYSSFRWGNNAKNNAGVTVEIVGLSSKNSSVRKTLYRGSLMNSVKNISPYITNSKDFIVTSSKDQLDKLPKMVMGSMPRDGGYLLLNSEEKQELLEQGVDPEIIRRYIGGNEFLKGKIRYCLWMDKKLFEKNKKSDLLLNRINNVHNYRLRSKADSTKKAADIPWSFVQKGEYEKAYGYKNYEGKYTILIPKVSSGNRIYVPFGLINARDIPFDKSMVIYNAPVWLLGLLQSRIHMIWLRTIGGKLKTDYSYSSTLVYNTFPVPNLSSRRKNEIEQLMLDILDIREEEGNSLAELYGSPLAEMNPKPMNPRLLKAHQSLDEVVDRAYKSNGFKDDNERLALLLDMYSERIKNEK